MIRVATAAAQSPRLPPVVQVVRGDADERAAADAVHAQDSGPDSSFQPERPAAPGSVLEAGGRCPRICPGFGWP